MKITASCYNGSLLPRNVISIVSIGFNVKISMNNECPLAFRKLRFFSEMISFF